MSQITAEDLIGLSGSSSRALFAMQIAAAIKECKAAGKTWDEETAKTSVASACRDKEDLATNLALRDKALDEDYRRQVIQNYGYDPNKPLSVLKPGQAEPLFSFLSPIAKKFGVSEPLVAAGGAVAFVGLLTLARLAVVRSQRQAVALQGGK